MPLDESDAGSRAPGLILALLSVLPAVAAAAWVLAALPLLVLHIYRPLPAAVLGLGLALALGRPAAHIARARARSFGQVPWWALLGVLLVVVAFGVLAYAHSADDILVRRDPASYAMSSTWLSSHGTLNMPTHAAAFGGTDPHLTLVSQGFFLQGSHIVPQFMTGTPVLLSIAGWFAGLTGVLHANAFIGLLALLAFAGLVTRLVGARWAPLATLTLALVQPELDVMRASYSEPAAQLILLGGLAIVTDAMVVGRLLPGRVGEATSRELPQGADAPAPEALRDCRRELLVGGVILGLVSVVRIDAIADLLPLIPLMGWLAYHRVEGWGRLALGVGLGLFAGAFDGALLTMPYLKRVGASLLEAGVVFVFAVVATVVGLRVARRREQARDGDSGRRKADPVSSHRAAVLAAASVLVVGLFFFLRPHLMTMRSGARSGGANYVGQIQKILHMTFDPTRSYYENATRWLSWYFGWAALALALAGACRLAYVMAAGRRREWLPTFLVGLGTAVAVLAKPNITPDHPWADRRFVPVVLPAVVLFAFAALAMAVEWAAGREWGWARVGAARGVALAAAALVLVAPAMWGSRVVFYSQTEKGETALVRQVCAAVKPGDVVISVGGRANAEWPGTLRVMCGVPVGFLDGSDDASTLQRVASRASAQGQRVVVLASDRGAAPIPVQWQATPFKLDTTEVAHTLVTRPGKPWGLPFEMWLGPLVSDTFTG